jgi:hypothetical protein
VAGYGKKGERERIRPWAWIEETDWVLSNGGTRISYHQLVTGWLRGAIATGLQASKSYSCSSLGRPAVTWHSGQPAGERVFVSNPSNATACPPFPLCSTLGPLPDFLLTSGKNARKFFSVAEELVTDTLTGNRPLLLPAALCCSLLCPAVPAATAVCFTCCSARPLLASKLPLPTSCRLVAVGPALPLPAGEQLLRQRFLLRTRQQFEEATGLPAPTGKQYFQVRLAGAALPELSCTVLHGLAVLHAATHGAAAATWPRPALASSFLPPLSLPWLCSALTCGMLHVLHFLALL